MSTGLVGLIAIFLLLGAFGTVVLRTYCRCAALPRGDSSSGYRLGSPNVCWQLYCTGRLVACFLSDLSLAFGFFVGILLVIGMLVQRE